ncbi:HAD family hydrolase [Dactylosporangium sp. NPDC051485]|uniref:HAD family hydrolase n=1 Tax=Dactylosporangium sp. NPDC051485 TaxID=3154846 RepID=UPI0034491D52
MLLVACDLDGTIVRHDGSISRRTLSTLDMCARLGVQTIFVTARNVRAMAPVVSLTGRRGEAICSNGAVVLDLDADRVTKINAFSPSAIPAAAGILRRLFPRVSLALDTIEGYLCEPGYFRQANPMHLLAEGPLTDLLSAEPTVTKILCRVHADAYDHPPSVDDLLTTARRELVGVADPVHANPRRHLLELSAWGTNKASTLAAIAAERGIPREEVVAFGDMPNDIPMLRWAGRSFAMEDGHPDVKAAATDVAPPCAEDGVAVVLERLLNGRA